MPTNPQGTGVHNSLVKHDCINCNQITCHKPSVCWHLFMLRGCCSDIVFRMQRLQQSWLLAYASAHQSTRQIRLYSWE